MSNSEYYKNIFIFPEHKSSFNCRSIPANAIVIDPVVISKLAKIFLILGNLRSVTRVLLTEFRGCDNSLFFLKNIILWLVNIANSIKLSKSITSTCKSRESEISDPIFYSFWMNQWALALSILKMKAKIKAFIFRCNGIDIYDERRNGNYMPFKKFNYKYTSLVVPNSSTSADYLVAKGIYPEKISTYYLGTKDFGIGLFDPTHKFTMISCGRISPEKRTHLIVEILQHIVFPIKWVHIGGKKEELDKIVSLTKSLPDNIEVEFTGYLKTHHEIIEFYKENSANLFINTSSTEGLPVSIQEAISFGVPILATNVGGVREVVTSQSGILIDADFDPKAVAQIIDEFRASTFNSWDRHKKVRAFWRENFESISIYSDFYKLISRV